MVELVTVLITVTFASAVWCSALALRSAKRLWRIETAAFLAEAVGLALILTVAAGLRFLLIPGHHAMYVDEPWYVEAACNLARLGQLVVCKETWTGSVCVPYEKGIGWPLVLAPWTMIFGCASSAGIQLTRILGCSSVLLAAAAARLAGGNWRHGFLAAGLLAIHPLHVAWSATAETNVAAATALLAGLCGALALVHSASVPAAALATSAFGLAAAIRPETALPGVVAGIIAGATAPLARPRRLALVAAIGLSCLAGAASGSRLWSMNESISAGAFLKLSNVLPNLRAIQHRDLLAIHAVVLALAIAGSTMLVRRRRSTAGFLLLSTAIAAALIALTYDRFHPRMLLSATVALVPLCSFGCVGSRGNRVVRRSILAALLLVLVGIVWRPALQAASTIPETQLLETRIAARAGRLPLAANALIIAKQPAILAATGVQHVMPTEDALSDTKQLQILVDGERPVLFLCDMYCETDFQGAAGPAFCRQILQRFALQPVVEEALNARTYGLYRIAGDREPNAPPLQCPIAPPHTPPTRNEPSREGTPPERNADDHAAASNGAS
ncbi:MAG: hypothetical protein HY270_23605 [Deltaproteobacteria bacterium]|nr:hypothetical protein [Deltaproteobacteria bacterium]